MITIWCCWELIRITYQILIQRLSLIDTQSDIQFEYIILNLMIDKLQIIWLDSVLKSLQS